METTSRDSTTLKEAPKEQNRKGEGLKVRSTPCSILMPLPEGPALA